MNPSRTSSRGAGRFSLIEILIVVAIICLLASLITGCQTTTNANGTKTTTLTPQGQQAVADGENLLLTAATDALNQYAATGKVNGKALLATTASNAATNLRTLQGTASAANPTAVQNAVTSAAALPTAPNTISQAAAASVKQQVAAGVPADQANENVATTLSNIAANPPAPTVTVSGT